jgi:hypothetical protein
MQYIYDKYAEYGPVAILHIPNRLTYSLSYFCHVLHVSFILHIFGHTLHIYVATVAYA